MMKFFSFAFALALGLFSLDAPIATAADDFTCGPVCNFKPQDYVLLASCLYTKFGNTTVNGHGKLADALFTCEDGGLYDRARRVSYTVRHPAAIVYAENTQDVVDAVHCAREAGYKVAPRGRGHSYGGWGAADGALVVDMKYTCNVEEMVDSIDRTKTGPHLVPGTNYIATIKAQAGCANANWLAAVYLGFEESEGALASIGTCPSVGITGYTLGGGLGDVSPITGYGLDLIAEYEMVLADGSVITVSDDEHDDLYWANRGGGGGIGVITSLTFKVVQSPSPGAFTLLREFNAAEGKTGDFWARFQDFMYDHPESYRFGGGTSRGGATLVFLGSAEEGVEILAEAGLLDEDLLDTNTPTSVVNSKGESVCDSDCPAPFPQTGVGLIHQMRTNGETQAAVTCHIWLTGNNPTVTGRSLDVCRDLGLDSSLCECSGFDGNPCFAKGLTSLSCTQPEVLDAILQAAADPTSFLSVHGHDIAVPDASDDPNHVNSLFWPQSPSLIGGGTLIAGGYVWPRLEAKTLLKLATSDIASVPIGNHLVHGASHYVSEDATAMPWRNAGFNMGEFSDPRILEIILQDKAFGGDASKLQGYYAYIGPESFSNWEKVYFGNHVDRLKRIKAKYDPYGVFDKPMQLHGSNVDTATMGGGTSDDEEDFEAGYSGDTVSSRNQGK